VLGMTLADIRRKGKGKVGSNVKGKSNYLKPGGDFLGTTVKSKVCTKRCSGGRLRSTTMTLRLTRVYGGWGGGWRGSWWGGWPGGGWGGLLLVLFHVSFS